jgi:hypothetical protein
MSPDCMQHICGVISFVTVDLCVQCDNCSVISFVTVFLSA